MPVYRFQIFLPLTDPDGRLVEEEVFEQTKSELLERFGGLTAYSRVPAKGFWSPEKTNRTIRDEIIVFEIIAKKRDKKFWKLLKTNLEHRFRQIEILIVVSQVELV